MWIHTTLKFSSMLIVTTLAVAILFGRSMCDGANAMNCDRDAKDTKREIKLKLETQKPPTALTPGQAYALFKNNKDNPEKLLKLLQKEPSLIGAMDNCQGDWLVLRQLVDNKSPEYREVVRTLRESPRIPALLALYLNQRESLALIEARAKNAKSIMRREFYKACARALGGEATDVMTVTVRSIPDTQQFKIPGQLEELITQTESRRRGLPAHGQMCVIITGDVKGRGEKHPNEIKIVRHNKSYPEREAVLENVDVKYDRVTGRFFFSQRIYVGLPVGFDGLQSAETLEFDVLIDDYPTINIKSGPQPGHIRIVFEGSD